MSYEAAAAVGPDLESTALVIADRRGRIAYSSPGATDLFGYPAEAMFGKGVSVLVPRLSGVATRRGFARV